ncbi:hypothetical protein WR25_11844 [Diploscapter pachys]|uniref:Uncharacterized protein n=1 Tax=Diploscapter pachys TaxID=2018661 RepID=A0A2A2M2W6_9BILA|nr:hypothetical protein WR25_11844 [Diploscapter pachys]
MQTRAADRVVVTAVDRAGGGDPGRLSGQWRVGRGAFSGVLGVISHGFGHGPVGPNRQVATVTGLFQQSWSIATLVAIFDLQIATARRQAVEVALGQPGGHVGDFLLDQLEAGDEFGVGRAAVALDAAQRFGNARVIGDEGGQLFADQAADLIGLFLAAIEPAELRRQRFEADADLVDQPACRRRQHRALRIEPAFGLGGQRLDVGFAQHLFARRSGGRRDGDRDRHRRHQQQHGQPAEQPKRHDHPRHRRGDQNDRVDGADDREARADTHRLALQPLAVRAIHGAELFGDRPAIVLADPGHRRAGAGDLFVDLGHASLTATPGDSCRSMDPSAPPARRPPPARYSPSTSPPRCRAR